MNLRQLLATALLGLTMFVAGCASSPATEPASATAKTYTTEEKAAMSQEEMVEAYNEDKEERDQVICTYERKTGTRMKTRVCMTVAEREKAREDAQDALQRAQRGTLTPPDNG